MKKGALLYLTPRRDARAELEASEQELKQKLALMQAVVSSDDRK